MGYDRGDSFPLEFEPNGIPFARTFRTKRNTHDSKNFEEKKNLT